MNTPLRNDQFLHLCELTHLKNQTVQLARWPVHKAAGLRILCITDGKFEWSIEGQKHILYPDDVLVICPWQTLGHEAGTLEIGAFEWLTILPEVLEKETDLRLGAWSNLLEGDQKIAGKLLAAPAVLPQFKPVHDIILKIENEIKRAEFAFQTRVNQLIDELLVLIVRQLGQQQNQRRDFSQVFQKLDQLLRADLEHPWTVEEMATIVGFGSTAFTEKVKAYSGFSPLNYLINIRISEAIKQMKTTQKSLTDIALEMGFYSSQHFSSTFKKLTGYTPGQYRKTNIR